MVSLLVFYPKDPINVLNRLRSEGMRVVLTSHKTHSRCLLETSVNVQSFLSRPHIRPVTWSHSLALYRISKHSGNFFLRAVVVAELFINKLVLRWVIDVIHGLYKFM